MSIAKYPPAYGHSLNAWFMKHAESIMGPNEPIFSPEFINRYGKPVYDYSIWQHLWSGDLTFEPPTGHLRFLKFVRQHGYKAFVNDCFTKTRRPGKPVGLTRLGVDKAFTRFLVDLFDKTEQDEIQRPSKINKDRSVEDIQRLRRKELKKAMEQRFGTDAEKCWTKMQIKYHLPDDAVKAIPDSVLSFKDDIDAIDDDNDKHDPEGWKKIIREEKGDPEDDEDEDSHIAAADESMDMVEDENLEDEDTEMVDDGYNSFFSGLTDRIRPEKRGRSTRFCHK